MGYEGTSLQLAAVALLLAPLAAFFLALVGFRKRHGTCLPAAGSASLRLSRIPRFALPPEIRPVLDRLLYDDTHR